MHQIQTSLYYHVYAISRYWNAYIYQIQTLYQYLHYVNFRYWNSCINQILILVWCPLSIKLRYLIVILTRCHIDIWFATILHHIGIHLISKCQYQLSLRYQYDFYMTFNSHWVATTSPPPETHFTQSQVNRTQIGEAVLRYV